MRFFTKPSLAIFQAISSDTDGGTVSRASQRRSCRWTWGMSGFRSPSSQRKSASSGGMLAAQVRKGSRGIFGFFNHALDPHSHEFGWRPAFFQGPFPYGSVGFVGDPEGDYLLAGSDSLGGISIRHG